MGGREGGACGNMKGGEGIYYGGNGGVAGCGGLSSARLPSRASRSLQDRSRLLLQTPVSHFLILRSWFPHLHIHQLLRNYYFIPTSYH